MMAVLLFAIGFAFLISASSIWFLAAIAPKWGLVDKPDNRKLHEKHVPVIGGLGIFLGVTAAVSISQFTLVDLPYLIFATAALLLLITGLVDDIWQLPARVRLVMQVIAALLMIFYGGVVLIDLGQLVSSRVLFLGSYSVFLTLFATIGVINALNMIDGIDGLAGALSFVCLGFLSIVAAVAHRFDYLLFIFCIMGAVGGFLLFNLRHFRRMEATVFMGDAGSTVLGFTFAWLFIALSQGEGRAMTPVTALWIFAIPLIDTTTVMWRRIKERKPLFEPDNSHLHHILKKAGFRITQAVLVIIGAQLILGSIGLVGLYQGISEQVMFFGFTGVFVIYGFMMRNLEQSEFRLRKWHRHMGLTVSDAREIYIGNLNISSASADVDKLLGNRAGLYDYRLLPYKCTRKSNHLYAVLDVGSPNKVANTIRHLSRGKNGDDSVIIRQFIPRNPANHRGRGRVHIQQDRRVRDRRVG